jgi:hypothetical protein
LAKKERGNKMMWQEKKMKKEKERKKESLTQDILRLCFLHT